MNKGLAWYTCGPTTYAPAHLGHARTYVCLDIVRRVLEHHLDQNQQPPPLFVMNITDVDDKILATSQETGELPLDLARRFEHDFWRDLDALNCLRPHVVTRVSEHVLSDIVPYIQRLSDQGMAYELDDGVYFDLRSFDEKLGKVTKYGKLAPPSIATDFFSIGNADASEHTNKKDPRDFVLWKKRKHGEALFWDSPWGEGRPGWHIECSAMIEAVSNAFKDTHEFMFHAGGVDLKFPHHTNEIAQSEAYNANRLEQQHREWIPHWVHTGHLHIDGLKMSKSLKNFVTIEELLDDHNGASSLSSPADDFRLWCLGLAGSYRGQAVFSMERIHEARSVREKLVKFLLDGSEWLDESRDSGPRNWMQTDIDLYKRANERFTKSQSAILNDLDGKVFLQELVAIADMGNAYLRTPPVGSAGALEHCISLLRKSLSLVGFSEKTVRVGLRQTSSESPHAIVGGTRALIEEFVNFRSGVRNAALVNVRNGESTETVREILRLCDESRDLAFPSIGLQLIDGDSAKSWRYCLPHSQGPSASVAEVPVTKAIQLGDIPLEDFFKVGQYVGMFSEFNDDGVPITNSDGSVISNRQMKKLMAKRQKHEERLRHAAEEKALQAS
ncbi:tRNA synthetases class I (C) catalytic domain [Fragilaria crotonensis]|nr:tRNA synthetases class I (C) catalytic domain [Fragilaria crotonensis]